MLYLLSGDRFLCLHRKEQIIKDISKAGSWGVEKLPVFDHAGSLCAKICSRDLFGPANIIYVYDGDIPEVEKCGNLLENLPQDRAFVGIIGPVDKRTKVYKKFKDIIEQLPPEIQTKSSRRDIREAGQYIKKIVGWKSTNEIFDFIFNSCDHNFGRTILEIEKIRTYFNGPIGKNKEDLLEIICEPEKPELSNLIEAINNAHVLKSFDICNRMLETLDFENYFMLFLSSLAENFYFMLHCRLAIENGFSSPNKIGEFISQHHKKGNSPMDPMSAAKRYYFFKDAVRIRDSHKIAKCIQRINEATEDSILKRRSYRTIFNRLLIDLFV